MTEKPNRTLFTEVTVTFKVHGHHDKDEIERFVTDKLIPTDELKFYGVGPIVYVKRRIFTESTVENESEDRTFLRFLRIIEVIEDAKEQLTVTELRKRLDMSTRLMNDTIRKCRWYGEYNGLKGRVLTVGKFEPAHDPTHEPLFRFPRVYQRKLEDDDGETKMFVEINWDHRFLRDDHLPKIDWREELARLTEKFKPDNGERTENEHR